MISSFLREVDENCALLDYYTTKVDNSSPTFRDNLTVSSSRVKNPIGCPETSAKNYHYSLRNSHRRAQHLSHDSEILT